jgi:hypothetical protein
MARRKPRPPRPSQPPHAQHVVIGLDGPTTNLYDDCPICQVLRDSGATVHTVDPLLEALVPIAPGAGRPPIKVILTPDPHAAHAIGSEEIEVDLPEGCRAGELILCLLFFEPALSAMFSPDDLHLERSGRRLAPGRVLHDGDNLRLCASRPPTHPAPS